MRRRRARFGLLISILVLPIFATSGSSQAADAPKLSQTRGAAMSPVVVTGHGLAGVQPGEKFDLRFEAEIERGWHIYGLKLSGDLGIPTTLTPRKLGPFQVAGSATESEPKTHFDPVLKETFLEHHGKVLFALPLRTPPGTADGSYTVQVDFLYQVCDAQKCLPSETLSFELTVVVGTGKSPSLRPGPVIRKGGLGQPMPSREM